MLWIRLLISDLKFNIKHIFHISTNSNYDVVFTFNSIYYYSKNINYTVADSNSSKDPSVNFFICLFVFFINFTQELIDGFGWKIFIRDVSWPNVDLINLLNELK